jgi:hypothetical protein
VARTDRDNGCRLSSPLPVGPMGWVRNTFIGAMSMRPRGDTIRSNNRIEDEDMDIYIVRAALGGKGHGLPGATCPALEAIVTGTPPVLATQPGRTACRAS